MFVVRRGILVLAMLVLMVPVAALAQNQRGDQSERRNARGVFADSPLFWRTDWVLELYVKQITRYYNLNEDQEEYTRKLLSLKVKNFLETHERDVRALLAEYMEYQSSQELPDPQTAMDFARRAAPLARDIRREIFEGNMRWREVLDPEQRTKHDQDLRQMTMWFDNLEQGLERWKEGKVQPTDLPGRVGRQPNATNRIEDAWEYWLRNFIRSYKLNEGQQQTAYSILRELKAEAARYRETNKERFAEMEATLKSIRERTPKTDLAELAKYQAETARITRQRADLERPIVSLFDQLRSRVEAIPTVDQRKARQAELDRLRAAARRPHSTQPAVSQPAETQAATAASE